MIDIYLDIEIENSVTKEQLNDVASNLPVFKPSVIVCLSGESTWIFVPDEIRNKMLSDSVNYIIDFEKTTCSEILPFSDFSKFIESIKNIRLVGHNVEKFDWPILRNSFLINDSCNPVFLDTLKNLKSITGNYISLGNLTKRTIGKDKTESGKDAPKMWRDGEHWRVIEYCLNDVLLHKELVTYAKMNGNVKYYEWTKEPSLRGVKEVSVNWL